MERGKNASVQSSIDFALELIDTELKIINTLIEHPQLRNVSIDSSEPLVLWGGSVNDLIEHHVPLEAAGLFRHPSTRKPMNFTETCGLIEKIYGVVIGNPSDRRGSVLDRQSNTAFADDMRKVYLAEADKRDGRPSRK